RSQDRVVLFLEKRDCSSSGNSATRNLSCGDGVLTRYIFDFLLVAIQFLQHVLWNRLSGKGNDRTKRRLVGDNQTRFCCDLSRIDGTLRSQKLVSRSTVDALYNLRLESVVPTLERVCIYQHRVSIELPCRDMLKLSEGILPM